MNRDTIAFLKPAWTTPSDKKQLTTLVIEGKRISKYSLTKKVGHGSTKQEFVGDLIITLYFILNNRLKEVYGF